MTFQGMCRRRAAGCPNIRLRAGALLFAAVVSFGGSETRYAPGAPNSDGLPPSVAPDDDWPHVRGVHYDGRSSERDLADAWSAEGPPVLWTRALGQGYSAFVAWDRRVATQYQTLAGQYVACLDADSGATVWEHRYDWPYEPAGVYPGPRATPTYAEGRIFFASPAGVVGCLDAHTGRHQWSVHLGRRFGCRGTEFGYSCSPTVVAGKVVMPVGGAGASMVALDARDGSLVWQAGDDAASYTPAYPIMFQGRQLILGYLQNALVCHDLASGELVWRRELSAGYDEHAAWPIYREPHLWLSSPFQAGSELLELTSDPQRPVKTIAKSRLMSNDIFSSVLVDGAIYGFDLREAQAKVHRPSRGRFRCVDWLTGKEHWSVGDDNLRRAVASPSSDAGKRVGHAAVIAADGKLILLNDTGELILARAAHDRYTELGRVSILGGEICWTQPTLHRRRLFVRNQSRAACVFLGKLDLLAQEARATALTAADIPQSRYVDWASHILGVEPEYAFDLPSSRQLRRWFLISLGGIMGGSLFVVAALRSLLPRHLTPTGARWLFWGSVFVLGALGTTFISRWLDDFVFTWPVAVFAAFQAVVWETGPRGSIRAPWALWRTRLAVSGFLLTCLAYFWLCRRLSLVFEWVFLCGFLAALPFSAVGGMFFQNRRWSWAWRMTTTGAAFAAYYWFAAAVLWLKQ